MVRNHFMGLVLLLAFRTVACLAEPPPVKEGPQQAAHASSPKLKNGHDEVEAASAITPENEQFRMQQLEELIAGINDPKSCEAVYYDLFKNPDKPKAAPNEDFGKAVQFLEKLKDLIPLSPAFKALNLEEPEVAKEWATRLTLASLNRADGPGAYAQIPNPKGDDLPTQSRDLQGQQLKKVVRAGYVPPQLRLAWGPGLPGTQTDAGKSFLLSHEATHLMNFAPPLLLACLSDPQAAAVRKKTEQTKQQQAFAESFHKFEYLNALEKLKGNPKKKEADETRNAALKEVFDNEAQIAGMKGVLDRVLKPFSEAAKAELLRDGDRFMDLKRKCKIASEAAAAQGNKKKGAVSNQGAGTEAYSFFEDCLKADYPSARALHQLVKKYSITPDGEYLPDPFPEAVPDYYGTEFAEHWIDSLPSPEAKREAALDVLRSMPPTLYPPAARDILDHVGVKPTNEKRVFRIILANPKFREFLGCHFHGETPKYCGG